MSKRQAYEFKQPKEAGPVFWKSLEEKANPEEAQKRAETEFPFSMQKDEGEASFGRRGFMVFAGITAALAGLEGCARRPEEKIVPYTRMPEYSLPGVAYHYATVRYERGEAIGLLVETHEGRPTKIEGNPDHPASMGATDVRTQASIFDLYDPDRSTGVKKRNGAALENAKLEEFDAWLAGKLKAAEADGGAKIRVLSQPTNSPTFLRLREAIRAKLPHVGFHTYASVNESNLREGGRIAFGEAVNVLNDFHHARVILALDSDFLQTEPGMVRNTRLFARGRRLGSPNDVMNRLYVVEPSYTITGANADHRLRMPARDVERYLAALANELATKHNVNLGAVAAPLGAMKAEGVPEKWIKVVAAELAAAKGRAVITAGTRQPARVHALVFALNAALGNIGQTVQVFPIVDPQEKEQIGDLKALAKDLADKRVETLIILGGNPVYDAPADVNIANVLGNATVVQVASHQDETSAKANWHIPLAHEYETWGDQRGLDGTFSVQQPLIAPLHGGVSPIEILGRIAGPDLAGGKNGHELVQATLKSAYTVPLAFEREWNKALQRGVVVGAVTRPFGGIQVHEADIAAAFKDVKTPAALGASNLEIAFAPDPKLFDGRHANNPWLLELPDPMTKIVWDNVALVSPATAAALGVSSGDVVVLSRAGAQVEIPAWILPGHADNSVTVTLGWGRTRAGRYGGSEDARDWNKTLDTYPITQKLPMNASTRGFNVAPLRTSDAMGFGEGGTIAKSDKTYVLTQTQNHHSMEGRPVAIDATVAEYRQTPSFPQYRTPDPKVLPLWNPVDYTKAAHRWGMTIDLNACTGCNACVIACQSENNINVVGKDQVGRGREMHWLRIDRYFRNTYAKKDDELLDEHEPLVALQPVACVQCEQAPCENVCPVNATAHSPEGLNDMAYNRCIGTRYCANNCPYKVRRFNYLEFAGEPLYGEEPETEKMVHNPNVTVRMRGVMEKCTYCVQRIQEGKIAAKREGRPMKDGDVTTACAQACPAEAIVFGDLNDPTARVSRLQKRDRGYRLMSELGTHPRTTHLAKIRNPHPEMV